MRAGKMLLEQNLEVSARSESGIGISQRRRFTQQKNPPGIGLLFGIHHHRRGASRQFRRKKTEAEFLVFDIDAPPVHAALEEETGGITVAHDTQRQLQAGQQKDRNQR